MIEYSGWVPTITGQLSFSLIGLDDKKCTVANSEKLSVDVPHRSIVVLRERVSKDVIAPVRWWHPERRAHYLMLADTVDWLRPNVESGQLSTVSDEIGALVGYIYVIPYEPNKGRRKELKNLFSSIKSDIASFRHGCDISKIKNRVQNKINEYIVRSYSIVDCRFILSRTGEFKISVPDDAKESLSKQAYYFVKDCAHRHYHHRNDSDNILPLECSNFKDDITWRRKTLWCLAKSVLESRRKNSLYDVKNAKGLLAYADAFQSGLAFITWDYNENKFVEQRSSSYYDFKHTRASVDAVIAEKENNGDEIRTKLSIFTSVSIGALAIWLSSVQVMEVACRSARGNSNCVSIPPLYSELVIFNLKYPVFLIFASLFSLYFIFHKSIIKLPIIGRFSLYLTDVTEACVASWARFAFFMTGGHRDALWAFLAGVIWLILGCMVSAAAVAMFFIPLHRAGLL